MPNETTDTLKKLVGRLTSNYIEYLTKAISNNAENIRKLDLSHPSNPEELNNLRGLNEVMMYRKILLTQKASEASNFFSEFYSIKLDTKDIPPKGTILDALFTDFNFDEEEDIIFSLNLGGVEEVEEVVEGVEEVVDEVVEEESDELPALEYTIKQQTILNPSIQSRYLDALFDPLIFNFNDGKSIVGLSKEFMNSMNIYFAYQNNFYQDSINMINQYLTKSNRVIRTNLPENTNLSSDENNLYMSSNDLEQTFLNSKFDSVICLQSDVYSRFEYYKFREKNASEASTNVTLTKMVDAACIQAFSEVGGFRDMKGIELSPI